MKILAFNHCPICRVRHEIDTDLTREQFEAALVRYSEGALLQDAFPDMPASSREILLTGMCDTAWNVIVRED